MTTDEGARQRLLSRIGDIDDDLFVEDAGSNETEPYAVPHGLRAVLLFRD